MDPGPILWLAACCVLAWRLCWPVLRVALWLALVGWYLATPAAP